MPRKQVKSGVVNAAWARRAVKSLDRAISEWNAAHPRAEPVRVVWGFADEEDAELLGGSRLCARQDGLLSYAGNDIEVTISHGPGAFSREYGDRATLYITFAEAQTLPRAARPLYCALRCCDEGVSLCLVPDGDTGEIVAYGVSTMLPLEGVTGRVLGRALDDLCMSVGAAYRLLAQGEGEDYWDSDAM